MKAYTDLEQSKKLAEILPLESADMCHKCIGDEPYDVIISPYSEYYEKYKSLIISKDFNAIPCWSLAALFDILPNNKQVTTTVSRGGWQMKPIEYIPNIWWCEYEDDESLTTFNTSADNPIDTCVEMILKLKEKSLL